MRRRHPGAPRVPPPASIAPGATAAAAELVAVRAAAASLATLDRIEAAAAKVEADIQAALRAQAELQARAGAAADAAVRAAQDSWIAARASEAAEGRVRGMLGLMTSYLAAVSAAAAAGSPRPGLRRNAFPDGGGGHWALAMQVHDWGGDHDHEN